MNDLSNLLSFRRWGQWLVVLGLAALAVPSRAQAAGEPCGLRVQIIPLANSSLLRIGYENAATGAVCLDLRTDQGEAIYSSVLQPARHVRFLNLAALPAGNYTVELRTHTARHREVIHLAAHTLMVPTVVAQQHRELVAGHQLPDEPLP